MLVDPYEQRLATFNGTRLLVETLGIVGKGIRDDADPRRLWTIDGLYAPIPNRALGGIRARACDKDGFVTFINQRDLEVLLGMGTPGTKCPWGSGMYQHVMDGTWCGFCMDQQDLLDDLMDRELFIRGMLGSLPYGEEVERKLHMDNSTEKEELLVSLWDMHPETGVSPDINIGTVDTRWARVSVRRL